MAATVIRNFIAKALFKKKGAIANNKAVEFSSNALEQRLKNFGIDPNAIKSEQELNQILSYVKQAEDQAFQQRFGDMLAGSRFDKQADVLDMTGKKINPSKGIMVGKEINEQTLKEGLMKTDNPFSDLVNTPRPKTLAEREAEVLAGMEKNNKEAVQRIRNRKMVEEAIDNASPGFAGDRKYDAQLVADDLAEKRFGKDFYDLDQRQQMDLYDESFQGLSDSRFKNKPDPEDMAQGGRAGFKFGMGPLKTLFDFANKKSPMKAYMDYLESIKTRMKAGKEAEVAGEVIPVAATGALITNQVKKKLKAMNEEQKKEFKKDMEKKADGGRIGYADGTPSFEEYLKERGMIEKRQNLEKLMKEYQEDMRRKNVMEQKQMAADGGRIGLKAGMTKRAFLKLMGGTGAAIGALKSGIFSGFGKGAGKQAAKEVVEQGVRSAPPPYFFELANKIKMLGKPDKVTYADRVEIHRYRGKNGDEYELIEDLNTGDVRITKDKTGIGSYGDKTFDTIEDRTVLDYRKGDVNVKDEGLETQKSFKEADEYEEYKVEFDQDGTEAGADDIAANVQKEIIEEAGGEAPSIKKAGGGIARMLGE